MQELSTLHDRHLNRPTLDDSVDEEQTIEITTKEITQVDKIFNNYVLNGWLFTLLAAILEYYWVQANFQGKQLKRWG